MSMTEPERHELYELAKRDVSERFAQLMIKALPPDPERLATKDDLAVLGADLRTEMAGLRGDMRTEMADLRTEVRTEISDLRIELRTGMAELRTEMRDMTSGQTRTMMLGLVGSVTALAATQMVIATL